MVGAQGWRRRRGSGVGRVPSIVALSLTALLLVACGRTGEATTRIDGAETEIDAVLEELVEVLELSSVSETAFGPRDRCVLPGGGSGATNRRSLRAPIPDVDDPLGRASAVLDRNDYALVPGDREGEVFGRRDGIRITVFLDTPTDQVAVDAATGCRALPR